MTHMAGHKAHGYCLCLCEECVTFNLDNAKAESTCHCPEGCACHRSPKKLPAAYYPKEEVQSVPQHRCVTCGTEVFRKGTRGRFPKYCPPCKEKQ